MLHKIVYDVETKRAFDEVAGRDPSKLGISIVVVYDYADDMYKTFREEDLKKMWPLFENADLIIGYNHKNFDNKVLSAYYPGNLDAMPHLDLLEEFYRAAGFRVRLANLAQVNLGEAKLADGLQAIKWYQQGDFESLERYCRQDVKVTKDLYEHALKHGKLKYKEITEIKEIPLNTSAWGEIKSKTINYTLPF
ncbi:MAG: hypothetical protein A2445_00230 [Candidatus Jacksonbacteria bacterium RIFOXYC2_FULL_44_29]|nr:MAG: DEAD/DEAH box helicase domain protein [Parcubacteria group bacterium GW2011_GWA2_42_28]KKT54719.1 MAG: DEAD/DEAH box helicase domain protein [Parcubacteria group bacterium GW2011_GWC2_44_22]OGY75317.1 MAG: hypothetical protein A2240_01740 [Candidatus Jacksonbacteria bacterium RIFOXYA2_FULL_43_12]OGY76227.1 MAG: hypothetical protein A2295_05825 [Candidatus Jacksonbacteria bacterium RIFOXYB2_FULL_44_15]OGY78082.1 MAG: hypothetical protein A2445_00230 [Candidatus Jacksonbacteria bacterium 